MQGGQRIAAAMRGPSPLSDVPTKRGNGSMPPPHPPLPPSLVIARGVEQGVGVVRKADARGAVLLSPDLLQLVAGSGADY